MKRRRPVTAFRADIRAPAERTVRVVETKKPISPRFAAAVCNLLATEFGRLFRVIIETDDIFRAEISLHPDDPPFFIHVGRRPPSLVETTIWINPQHDGLEQFEATTAHLIRQYRAAKHGRTETEK